MESGGNNVQDLVDCFDEIPEMMSKIKSSQQNRSRFQILEPNHSYSVAYALRGNRSMDSSHPGNVNQVNRMAQQAKKVLDHLNQIPRTKAAGKDMETCARLAEVKLTQLRDNGVDLTKFYQQYDVHRNGKISYKDFSDTLLSLSAGIGRDDAMQLAARLDKNKAGSIDYKSIFSSLHQIQSSPKKPSSSTSSSAANTVAFGTCKSTSNHTTTDKLSHSIEPAGSTPHPTLPTSSAILDPAFAASHYIPKALFTLEALSPTVYDKKKDNIFEAGGGESSAGTVERASRRFYHDRPNTNVTARLKLRLPPFYVDPSTEDRRQRHRQTRRAHSEPPTAVRSLTQHLSRPPPPPTASAAAGGASSTPAGGDKTLRTSLHQPPAPSSSSASASALLSTEHTHIVQPLTQLLHQSQAKQQQTQAVQLKVAENSLLHQMRGNLTIFRHLLQQQDPSQSGVLTPNEFQAALRKAGVDLAPACVQALVEKHAAKPVPVSMLQDGGLAKGRGVSIDRLVDTLQARSFSPAFHHVMGDAQQSVLDRKEAVKVRILKKIAHGMNKHSNPHKLFADLTAGGEGKGRGQDISSRQFQEALQYAGVQLSDTEMAFMLREMDVGGRGGGREGPAGETSSGESISLPAWDRLLHASIQAYDQSQADRWKGRLQQSRHYSRSFQSSDLFPPGAVPEFHRLEQTQHSRRERRQWEKLREHIQVHHPKVLRAFRGAAQPQGDGSRMDVAELCRSLQREGVLLGQEDLSLLRDKVREQASETGAIGMEAFCSVMGIPLKMRNGSNAFETVDPTEVLHEEGVFASSRRSISANPKFSTSVFLQTDEEVRRLDFGERKRRGGPGLASSGDASATSPADRTQTSKFWEFEKSVDNPMLFPCPRTEVLPSFSNSLDVSSLRRGVVRLKDGAAASKLSARSLSSWQHSLAEGDSRLGEDPSVSSANLSRTRAHSAPPTTRSLASYHDSRLSAHKSSTRPSGDGPAASSRPPPPPPAAPAPTDGVNMSGKLSKWSSDTLTNYFAQKVGGLGVPPTRVQRSDSRESTVSPSSYHSASTNSLGTTDRTGRTPSSRFFSHADKGRGALRRQYDPRAAPFATDLQ